MKRLQMLVRGRIASEWFCLRNLRSSQVSPEPLNNTKWQSRKALKISGDKSNEPHWKCKASKAESRASVVQQRCPLASKSDNTAGKGKYWVKAVWREPSGFIFYCYREIFLFFFSPGWIKHKNVLVKHSSIVCRNSLQFVLRERQLLSFCIVIIIIILFF